MSVALGVVCPMANEAATAVPFVDAVLDECAQHELASVTFYAVLDNVSRDGTRGLLEAHAAERPELQVVWAPESRGVADAYQRGYREALAGGADWILEIDAGFSHDPRLLGAFFAQLEAGNDVVLGTRFLGGGTHVGSLRRRIVSRGGTLLANLLLGTRLSDMTSGYQLFTRAALESVLAKGIASKGPFFQTEMKAHTRGLRVAEVPISYRAGGARLGRGTVTESLVNLARLFRQRLAGTL